MLDIDGNGWHLLPVTNSHYTTGTSTAENGGLLKKNAEKKAVANQARFFGSNLHNRDCLKAGLQCSLFPGNPQLIMKPHFKKFLLLPLLGIITGCSTVAEMAVSARATHSNMVAAYAENLCEAATSSKPDTDRQAAMDYCTQDMYSRVMTKARTRSAVQSVSPAGSAVTGQKVYRADECVGAVVNGQCHGSIIPKGYAPTCHGTMLNGQCTGPMF